MSDPWALGLLGVFAVHLPIFAWRWWRTRELRFAATTLTFALLVVTYALRLLAPELHIGCVRLHEGVRVAAWTAATVSIGLLARRHLSRRR